MNLIIFLIIGGLAGWAAGKMMSGHGYGVLMDVILGIVGGFIGGWLLANVLHLGDGGLLMEFIASFVGAVILVAIARMFNHRSARV